VINIYEKLSAGNHKTKMLLQVHDELVFDVYKPELETIKQLVKTEMENAYNLSVPLDVDFGFGGHYPLKCVSFKIIEIYNSLNSDSFLIDY
jgi:DNA polymerase-1